MILWVSACKEIRVLHFPERLLIVGKRHLALALHGLKSFLLCYLIMWWFYKIKWDAGIWNWQPSENTCRKMAPFSKFVYVLLLSELASIVVSAKLKYSSYSCGMEECPKSQTVKSGFLGYYQSNFSYAIATSQFTLPFSIAPPLQQILHVQNPSTVQ